MSTPKPIPLQSFPPSTNPFAFYVDYDHNANLDPTARLLYQTISSTLLGDDVIPNYRLIF